MGAITGYLSKMHEIEDKIDILIEYISVYMYVWRDFGVGGGGDECRRGGGRGEMT